MDVPVELSRIVIVETSPQQVIFLKEKGGERYFPITIGVNEALAIDRRLKRFEMPRPMTHDLLAGVIDAMGGRLDKIVINDLRKRIFYAKLVISRGDEILEVDSRPSDAVALGVGFDTPIFVAEHVLDEVSHDVASLTKRENLQHRRDELVEVISMIRTRLEDKDFEAGAEKKQLQTLREQLKEMEVELEDIDEILRRFP